MIKNLQPVDGSEQLNGEAGSRGRTPNTQGRPCLCILITAPAAFVAFLPFRHAAIGSRSFVEKTCDASLTAT